jgi:hypothetical protein
MISPHSQKAKNPSWKDLVSKASDEGKLLGSTCKLYSAAQANDNILTPKRCLCGRRPREHSFDQEATTDRPAENDSWNKAEHAKQMPVTVYGIWKNKTKVYFDKLQSFIFFNLL